MPPWPATWANRAACARWSCGPATRNAPGPNRSWPARRDSPTWRRPPRLGELAAIVRRAAMFIGSDTGPLHLAAAVGTPCVGLFGPMPAERNGPYGPQHVAVQKMCLTGTSRQRRTAGPESMEAITVETSPPPATRFSTAPKSAERLRLNVS